MSALAAESADGPRILIVDDHALAREGLKAVLANGGFVVVGDVATGEEAVAEAARLIPDVVLMDVRLGSGIDGLEATRQICNLDLPTRVLMLTLHDMPGYVREALAAGASGYVLKDTAIEDLRSAVQLVLAGQTAIPRELMASAMQAVKSDTGPVEKFATLTARERQVVACISDGLTNKEIARNLEISPATVKAHVERILSKLDVADRTQAAVLAARLQGSGGRD